jgi:hypothetical protein
VAAPLTDRLDADEAVATLVRAFSVRLAVPFDGFRTAPACAVESGQASRSMHDSREGERTLGLSCASC